MIIKVLLEILKILGGVIVGAVLTYFFNVKQLKARYVLDIKSELGKKIANALIETRKYEQQTSVKVPFSPSLDYETEKKGSPEDVVFIPDIISSSDNLVAFGEETSKTRMEYEQYLSKETAVYLYIMEKYMLQLVMYIRNNNLQEAVAGLGVFIDVDLSKWRHEFDRALVMHINNPKYELSIDDKKYEFYQKTWEQFWQESELKKIVELRINFESDTQDNDNSE